MSGLLAGLRWLAVACWLPPERAVLIVHDFAEPGRERRGRYEGFNDWLLAAIEDFFEFGRNEIDYYQGSALPFPWG